MPDHQCPGYPRRQVDTVSDSRSRLGQKTLSRIHVLSGKNGLKHPCEQTEKIRGWRPCYPTDVPAKSPTLRVPPDKEGKGSRAGIGGNHRMGAEALPGHEEIPSRRAPLGAYALWRWLSSSPGKRHDMFGYRGDCGSPFFGQAQHK